MSTETARAVFADIGVGYGMLAIGVAPVVQARPTSPSAHGDAALARGGVHLALTQHPARTRAFASHGWWVAGFVPSERPARVRLPDQMNVRKHARQAALSASLALALTRGDAELLRIADADAVVEPALGPSAPGAFPALNAARSAGALLAGFANQTFTLCCVCETQHSAEQARDAVATVFATHRVDGAPFAAAIPEPLDA